MKRRLQKTLDYNVVFVNANLKTLITATKVFLLPIWILLVIILATLNLNLKSKRNKRLHQFSG